MLTHVLKFEKHQSHNLTVFIHLYLQKPQNVMEWGLQHRMGVVLASGRNVSF